VTRFVLGGYAALSLLTFGVYAWDKLQSKRDGRRVPELRLHALSLVGGFAGAALAMALLRHKTQKLVFQGVITLAVLGHGAFWVWWATR
jgi:uncharacterized membrane protein YsdA (DUF1294 family)